MNFYVEVGTVGSQSWPMEPKTNLFLKVGWNGNFCFCCAARSLKQKNKQITKFSEKNMAEITLNIRKL